jgi:uncharacterized protein (DUF1015 family)
MCNIVPFKAVRPPKEFVKDVASYPYDIIDSEEARRLTENNPRSFLHVVKSEIDLPSYIDIHDERVYSKAKENFYNFLHEGTLFKEDKPCLYIYRQQMGDHKQYGIVGCVSVDEYESGQIKKHELTRPDKQADRTKHIATLNAQTGPVFLAFRRKESLDRIIQKITRDIPEYDFTADDGISHTAWVIRDEHIIDTIQKEFLAIDALYIADGHHRAASAAAVAQMRRAENPDYTGREEFNYMMAVIFPGNQLNVLAYNRVVKDLNNLTEAEFIDRVKDKFVITENFLKKMPEQLHEFGMYIKGSWYQLKAREITYKSRDVIGALDVSILQDYLLGPILGIGDVRTDERIMFVGGIRGVKELERLVDSGECVVAFSLYPTTLHQMADVADTGKLMPPKSTWFEPKLRSGMFVHLID